MNIIELLTKSNIGRTIISKNSELPELIITEDKENNDILLTDINGNIVAISLILLKEEWEIKEINSWEIANEDSEYYYINDLGLVKKSFEKNTLFDNLRYLNCNYLLRKEDAKELLNELLIYKILKKFKSINDHKEIDWKDENEKYYIAKNSNDEYIIKNTKDERALNVIYFSTEELAKEALENIKNKLK